MPDDLSVCIWCVQAASSVLASGRCFSKCLGSALSRSYDGTTNIFFSDWRLFVLLLAIEASE
jgi:hypothetical protein